MLAINPSFITNAKGKKISVVLPIKDYKALMEELEELEDVRLYDKAKKVNESTLPVEKAFELIETKRRKK